MKSPITPSNTSPFFFSVVDVLLTELDRDDANEAQRRYYMLSDDIQRISIGIRKVKLCEYTNRTNGFLELRKRRRLN